VVAQRAERRVELGGVRDEVPRALVAEHRGLGGPQAPELHRQHHDPDQRHEREAARGQRDDAGGAAQLVHEADATE
jgi:hypothetical protein